MDAGYVGRARPYEFCGVKGELAGTDLGSGGGVCFLFLVGMGGVGLGEGEGEKDEGD